MGKYRISTDIQNEITSLSYFANNVKKETIEEALSLMDNKKVKDFSIDAEQGSISFIANGESIYISK